MDLIPDAACGVSLFNESETDTKVRKKKRNARSIEGKSTKRTKTTRPKKPTAPPLTLTGKPNLNAHTLDDFMPSQRQRDPSTTPLKIERSSYPPENVSKPQTRFKIQPYLTWEEMSTLQRIKFNKYKQFLRENPELMHTMVQVIEGKHRVSKRIIEHLITNYAKKYHVILENDFLLYEEYRKNLPKSNMDPCRRGPRVKLKYTDRYVETTLQQLESLSWVLTTPIFAYAEENYDIIKKDLNIEKNIHTKKNTNHIHLPEVQNAHFVLDYFHRNKKIKTFL